MIGLCAILDLNLKDEFPELYLRRGKEKIDIFTLQRLSVIGNSLFPGPQ